jgi:hypothetical protein
MDKNEKKLKCFCDDEISYMDKKSSHFIICEKFRKEFKDINYIITRYIRRFYEGDNTIKELELLKFFLKKYIMLINDLINKYKEQRNKNEIEFDKPIIEKNINSILKVKSHLDLKKHEKQIFEEKINIDFKNEIKDEKDILYNYCKDIYDTNPIYNEDLLNKMSFNISELTSKECYLMISKNDKEEENSISQILFISLFLLYYIF